MNAFLSSVYNIIVPKFIRKKIMFKKLPEAIVDYYKNLPEAPSLEIETVLNYLKNNSLAIFPYDFQQKYRNEDVEVFEDKENGLRYVFFEGKRLYFKKKWSSKEIRKRFNWLLIEQDIQSPHRYLTENFRFEDGEVLIDVGAADGNFALSVVEKASRIVIFETSKEWIEPLEATFEPWKEKVLIVKKFVSDVTSSTKTTLDDFLPPGESGLLFKIDVEGEESRLLNGCKRILSDNKPQKMILCTYHKQNDYEEFSALLSKKGFEVSHSEGFMIFLHDKKLRPPYLRRGLIRAEKKL